MIYLGTNYDSRHLTGHIDRGCVNVCPGHDHLPQTKIGGYMTELEFDYGIVEIMGHVVLAGRISEVSMFGTALLRVDCPPTPNRPNGLTQLIGGSSIYRITPTTEQVAKEIAEHNDPSPTIIFNLEHRLRRALPPGESEEEDSELEYIDEDEDYQDDDDDDYFADDDYQGEYADYVRG